VQVSGTRTIGVVAGEGNDRVDASALGDGGVTDLDVAGGRGNDVLRGGAVTSSLAGGSGTNTLVGGSKADVITSESASDTVQGGEGVDVIVDKGSGPVGGRTFVAPAEERDEWILRADGDAAVRTRSDGASARVTAALARSGIQRLGPDVGTIHIETDGAGLPQDRVVLDLAALPGHAQRISSTSTGTVVDLVVPTGSWSRSGSTVSFSGPYGEVVVANGPTVGVRAPFTDREERFAHRIVRDAEMRLPTTGERRSLQAQLEAGVLTRASLAVRLTSTDTFHGLSVDRAFTDILRRPTDSAGRDYWVGRLRRGLITRKLRANLYGSAEYLTTQGGGTVQGFVTAAYRDILGRDADPAGLDHWVGLIRSGTPRGTVAERFLATAEARDVIVRDLFLRWIDRLPTTTELTTWRGRLGSSTADGEVALIRFLAGSSTYFTRPDV
jgi:hypothetical protein